MSLTLAMDTFLLAQRQGVETLSKPVNETERYGEPVTNREEEKQPEEDELTAAVIRLLLRMLNVTLLYMTLDQGIAQPGHSG